MLQQWRLYARLARLDKPVGIWLLYFPCLWGLGLGASLSPGLPLLQYIYYAALFFIGAVLMRSAGCVYNDMLDRDFDALVARTAERPLASGQISMRRALLLMIVLAVLALLVLLPLNSMARMVAVASIVPVAVYPLMKRITYWPQLFLGIAFNWGVLVGAVAVTGELSLPILWLYAAGVFWTLGYDTIYALQDIEDDIRIGVKSSAIAVRHRPKPFLFGCYAGMVILLLITGTYIASNPVYFGVVFVVSCLLFCQVRLLAVDTPADALRKFKQNQWIGLLVGLAFLPPYILSL